MHPAAVGNDDAADHFDGRRLARAVRTQKTKYLTGGYSQIEVFHRVYDCLIALAVYLAQGLDLDGDRRINARFHVTVLLVIAIRLSDCFPVFSGLFISVLEAGSNVMPLQAYFFYAPEGMTMLTFSSTLLS